MPAKSTLDDLLRAEGMPRSSLSLYEKLEGGLHLSESPEWHSSTGSCQGLGLYRQCKVLLHFATFQEILELHCRLS